MNRRVKSLDWYEANKDENGNIWDNNRCTYFNYKMAKYCGQLMDMRPNTHYKGLNGEYEYEYKGYLWCEWMLEPLEEKVNKVKVSVSEKFISQNTRRPIDILWVLNPHCVPIPPDTEFINDITAIKLMDKTRYMIKDYNFLDRFEIVVSNGENFICFGFWNDGFWKEEE